MYSLNNALSVDEVLAAGDVVELVRDVVNLLADELASRYALGSSRGRVSMQIARNHERRADRTTTFHFVETAEMTLRKSQQPFQVYDEPCEPNRAHGAMLLVLPGMLLQHFQNRQRSKPHGGFLPILQPRLEQVQECMLPSTVENPRKMSILRKVQLIGVGISDHHIQQWACYTETSLAKLQKHS